MRSDSTNNKELKLFYLAIATIAAIIGIIGIQTYITNNFIKESMEAEVSRNNFYEITSASSEAETGLLTHYLGTEINGEALMNNAINQLKLKKQEKLSKEDLDLVNMLIQEYTNALIKLAVLDEKLNNIKSVKEIQVIWKLKNDILRHYLGLQDSLLIKKIVRQHEMDTKFASIEKKAEENLAYSRYALVALLGLLVVLSFLSIQSRNHALLREEKLTQKIIEAKNSNSILREQKETLELQEQIIAQTGKFSSLGEVAGSIGHDINNTVSVISIRAEQLLLKLQNKKEIPEDKLYKNMSSIYKSSQKLEKLTKGLRDFTRVSTKDPFEKESISLIINETEDFFLGKLKSRQIDYKAVVEGDDFEFDCRKIDLVQVLLNLVNNAADEIEKHKVRLIRVTAKENDGFAEIRVIDSGGGLKNADLELITQSHYTTKPAGKGTGLGLSICQKIVEEHGGSFTIDENYPTTCFLAKFPLTQEKEDFEESDIDEVA